MTGNSRIKPDCPCTEECERHGKCKDCHGYHNNKGDLPYCQRFGPSTGEKTSGEHPQMHGHHHDHMHGHEHGPFGHDTVSKGN
jgi:hypothetical protein